MLLLGIDIAKLNHVASLVDSTSRELIFSNFKFQNNFIAFSSLLEKISKFPITEIIIGLKSTGHYGGNLINFSFKKILTLLLSILYKLHIYIKQILAILKITD